jgi:hypothetical protein
MSPQDEKPGFQKESFMFGVVVGVVALASALAVILKPWK